MQELIKIITEYVEEAAKEQGILLTDIRSIHVPSQVNFLFDGLVNGKEAIIKVNFFDRSMLYTYEEYVRLGCDAFKVYIYKNKNKVKNTIQDEKESYKRLLSLGVNTPQVYAFIKPNILVLEKLQGETLKDILNQSRDIDKDKIEELVIQLLKIHRVKNKAFNHSIIIEGDEIIFSDSHLKKNIRYTNVHKNISQYISKIIHEEQSLIHGDFKLNNLFIDKNIIKLIDPHVHFNNLYTDIGWLTIMAFIFAKARNKVDSVYKFMQMFYKIYAERSAISIKELEELSIIMGFLQINNLLLRERRPKVEILGDEMPDMYKLQSSLLKSHEAVITNGNLINLKQLFYS